MSRKRQQSVLRTAVEALTRFSQTPRMTRRALFPVLQWLCLTLSVGSLTAPLAAWAAPESYHYDPVHSQILFSIDHDGFSRPFGRLRMAQGWLRFDQTNWSQSSTELDIDMNSLDMGDGAWNAAVCKSSLLDCKQYGTAHFVSTSVEQKDATHGVLHGTLTLHGVSKPMDIPFRVNRVGNTIYGMHTIAGFSATASLDRTDFGITAFSNSIGHNVVVWLELEAIRDSQTSATNKESP
jgi:polyisoprenoid-binding protein YceI